MTNGVLILFKVPCQEGLMPRAFTAKLNEKYMIQGNIQSVLLWKSLEFHRTILPCCLGLSIALAFALALDFQRGISFGVVRGLHSGLARPSLDCLHITMSWMQQRKTLAMTLSEV